MYTEAFYTLTLGNRVFPDIFHLGPRLIHISIYNLLKKHIYTHLQEREHSCVEAFDSGAIDMFHRGILVLERTILY